MRRRKGFMGVGISALTATGVQLSHGFVYACTRADLWPRRQSCTTRKLSKKLSSKECDIDDTVSSLTASSSDSHSLGTEESENHQGTHKKNRHNAHRRD